VSCTCTWKGCDAEATHPQIAKDGEEWANLCDEHHTEVELAIKSMVPKRLLRAWIRAQGGSKLAAARMVKRSQNRDLGVKTT